MTIQMIVNDLLASHCRKLKWLALQVQKAHHPKKQCSQMQGKNKLLRESNFRQKEKSAILYTHENQQRALRHSSLAKTCLKMFEYSGPVLTGGVPFEKECI